MTVFVLLSQQRSGTGALASFITSHPNIKNLTEILNPYGLDHEDNFFNFWLQSDPAAMIREARSPSDLFIEYLNRLEKKYSDCDIMLEIKLNSIRHVLNYWEELPGFTEVGMPWLLYIFNGRGYPIIYLHRDNHLHRFVSSKFAELTNVYRTNDPKAVGHGKIEVDLEQMTAFIFKSERSHECFMTYFDNFRRRLFLNYKTSFVGNALTADTKIGLARFFGFQLRLDAEPYYIKLRTAKLNSVIVNYSEVCDELTRQERSYYIES